MLLPFPRDITISITTIIVSPIVLFKIALQGDLSPAPSPWRYSSEGIIFPVNMLEIYQNFRSQKPALATVSENTSCSHVEKVASSFFTFLLGCWMERFFDMDDYKINLIFTSLAKVPGILVRSKAIIMLYTRSTANHRVFSIDHAGETNVWRQSMKTCSDQTWSKYFHRRVLCIMQQKLKEVNTQNIWGVKC